MTPEQEKLLMEILADIEHQRWSDWQSYLHSMCIKNDNGSLTIPADLAEHWNRQINTKYEKLEDYEKESDREQVRRYINIIKLLIS